MACTLKSLSQEVGLGLGAQAGEERVPRWVLPLLRACGTRKSMSGLPSESDISAEMVNVHNK
jgi:hypothetical protein